MTLAITLTSILAYLVLVAVISKGIYRISKWGNYTSETEAQVFSFLWGLLAPFTGLFLLVRLYMLAPTISEARRARQERAAIEAKHRVLQRVADLEKSERELTEVTDRLRKMGISV